MSYRVCLLFSFPLATINGIPSRRHFGNIFVHIAIWLTFVHLGNTVGRNHFIACIHGSLLWNLRRPILAEVCVLAVWRYMLLFNMLKDGTATDLCNKKQALQLFSFIILYYTCEAFFYGIKLSKWWSYLSGHFCPQAVRGGVIIFPIWGYIMYVAFNIFFSNCSPID